MWRQWHGMLVYSDTMPERWYMYTITSRLLLCVSANSHRQPLPDPWVDNWHTTTLNNSIILVPTTLITTAATTSLCNRVQHKACVSKTRVWTERRVLTRPMPRASLPSSAAVLQDLLAASTVSTALYQQLTNQRPVQFWLAGCRYTANWLIVDEIITFKRFSTLTHHYFSDTVLTICDRC